MRRTIVAIAIAVLALLLVLALPGAVGAGPPPTEEWVAIYDGPGSYDDSAHDIAVDGVGNVYVTGYSWGLGTDYDYATIKYDSDGNELWVARYDGPASGFDQTAWMAVDGAGNVYVTGYSEGNGTLWDYATIKYDGDGNELWVARYDGPANKWDGAHAIAVDGVGNVYVTGKSFGTGTLRDYATIKYDSNGNELWVARYDGPASGDDETAWIAVDGLGNVYVTGYSEGNGTLWDYATVKYDSDGNELWVARYDGPASGEDYAIDIAVDGVGNVYVTGWSYGAGTYRDYATIKYNSDGNELWVARYDGPGIGSDRAFDIAVDGAGNVHVTGYSVGTGTGEDYTTIKYDGDGNELWVARYDGPGSYDDEAEGIALDGSGNVYVTGASEGDYATVKYDPDGNELWVAKYDGPASSGGWANAIAVDGSGNVYVTGCIVVNGTSTDYATIKFPPARPVGGTIVPTDKIGLVMPWVMAAALIVVAGVSLAVWNRKWGAERGSD